MLNDLNIFKYVHNKMHYVDGLILLDSIFSKQKLVISDMHSQLNWIERLTTDQKVMGSTPIGCTIITRSGSTWQSTWFGTKGLQVQILSSRPRSNYPYNIRVLLCNNLIKMCCDPFIFFINSNGKTLIQLIFLVKFTNFIPGFLCKKW